jgi:hypothetical protein
LLNAISSFASNGKNASAGGPATRTTTSSKGRLRNPSYRRLRSAGFIFSAAPANTRPLYRCYSESEKSHFAANRDDCNRMGKREALLGYGLKQ